MTKNCGTYIYYPYPDFEGDLGNRNFFVEGG